MPFTQGAGDWTIHLEPSKVTNFFSFFRTFLPSHVKTPLHIMTSDELRLKYPPSYNRIFVRRTQPYTTPRSVQLLKAAKRAKRQTP